MTSSVAAGRTIDTVVGLDQITKDDVEIAGGKGANLGELIHAGLPVPPGFVVTAPAYLDAMERGGVRDTLRTRVAEAATADGAALDRLSQELRQLL
jgi:pyruvate,water dikinase